MEKIEIPNEFVPFQKIGRYSRNCTISEKIDGTSAQIYIGKDGQFLAGSRTRYITPENDNFGFAKWAYAHKDELMGMGAGRHYGEWWGPGIQRGYGLAEKRFSLFNSLRWGPHNPPPACCHVVPMLGTGPFDTTFIQSLMDDLSTNGSKASPGFMRPEGIVIYHSQSRSLFKKTFEKDSEGKDGNSAE